MTLSSGPKGGSPNANLVARAKELGVEKPVVDEVRRILVVSGIAAATSFLSRIVLNSDKNRTPPTDGISIPTDHPGLSEDRLPL
ncbi:hypothetical protein HN512_01660 [Candidatus Peregrinibacteria bacterium]|jgi:hypothetical protein|nr:hypothetical protein [Candidatus Peregrinibacteria bacterium]MBT3598520.1 hypothetical protein [Candidatus Peregrinibacteria bacterium]MBT4366803.1 hypothetical protein [Candidatus Peregrinibacteria bacterium]MBT4586084.1 hypothetical protein [Candidatus Peregrinibacteria bacterium]MBT6730342.1 hypothetical protein [Candidatus Peregrinibacteria bacterium]